MKINIPLATFSLFLTAVIFLSSCASTTVIHSIPEEAKVYLNSSFVGYTPYTLKDKKLAYTKTDLMLKKDGYEPFKTQLSKEGKIRVGPIIAGVIFWFPFVWMEGYEDEYTFELQEATEE